MNNSKIFHIKGEQIDKLSCHYYDPETIKIIHKLEKSPLNVSLNLIKSEIISGPMGFQLHTTDYVPQDFPDSVWLLQISNLGELGNLIKTKYDKFISKEKNEELKNSKVQKDDIIIAKTGVIDRCVLINEDLSANLNQALGIIRLKEKHDNTKISSYFVHEFLNSKYGISQLMRLGGYRAGQSGLSLDEIGSVKIPLPDYKEQLYITKQVEKIKQNAKNKLSVYYMTLRNARKCSVGSFRYKIQEI